ncbi:hypothetical protein GCM10007416_35530 [Kroppenstedtia guangzhouensis]|uniref:Uncharacterized protein n=1 Tax=Kroppenstedtia guangzhouensis TaxID=1274356 RepID=A0ABQ1H6C2_9BACL|nr:hypothetical protein [Kroppenstedtia guangzhouensis]GGA59327.1 hypothetical protein GCM10007416_35530 [Kroppenstedtia guangzhouensis]
MNQQQQQIVRITSLAKTLHTFENALDSLVQSGMVCRPEEVEAFKRGFRASLDLLRKEYGIIKEDE